MSLSQPDMSESPMRPKNPTQAGGNKSTCSWKGLGVVLSTHMTTHNSLYFSSRWSYALLASAGTRLIMAHIHTYKKNLKKKRLNTQKMSHSLLFSAKQKISKEVTVENYYLPMNTLQNLTRNSLQGKSARIQTGGMVPAYNPCFLGGWNRGLNGA